MATSADFKLAKLQASENEKQRLMQLLLDPRVIGTLSLVAGIYGIEHIRFSDDEGRNQRLKSAALAAVIYAGLTTAGAKGWPAAIGSLVGGLGLGSSGGGTPYSPLQAGEATAAGALVGSVVPGVGTLVGAGVGLGIDTIYQWVT
jgi:hypothetical protein